MLAPWVIDEMKTVDLKDKRLNDRLGEVLSQLGGTPDGEHSGGLWRVCRDDRGLSFVR